MRSEMRFVLRSELIYLSYFPRTSCCRIASGLGLSASSRLTTRRQIVGKEGVMKF